MSKRLLTNQECHQLAMNIVGKDLQSKGFEFIAINSQLKKHPQFVCVDRKNQRYFVIAKATQISEQPITYNVVWMETFKIHANKQNAKVIFAGVGLADEADKKSTPYLNEPYLLQYDGLQFLATELN